MQAGPQARPLDAARLARDHQAATKAPRAELERLRDRGYTFKQAMPVAVSNALRDESLEVAIFYREVFREQQGLWAVSYSRAPWPANRRATIVALDVDRSSPARPRGAAPVAA